MRILLIDLVMLGMQEMYMLALLQVQIKVMALRNLLQKNM